MRLLHLESLFRKLAASGYEKTSDRTGRPPTPGAYNCIAWAASDMHAWWWPNADSYWPFWSKRETTIPSFIKAFVWLGYRVCDDSRLEAGYEKVALYAARQVPKHMARQLPDGTWTSKIGELEDITHNTLDAVEPYGLPQPDDYGTPVVFMKRSVIVSRIVCFIQSKVWKS